MCSLRSNVGKTEVIPCGTLNFRKTLINTRKLNANVTPIQELINIAIEGELV